MSEARNKTALRSKGQELIDLATGKQGEYTYNQTSFFSQDVASISAKTDKTFVDENGELKKGYYNLRFNYTDRWNSIFMISLVYIEVYVMDTYQGERATHTYKPIHDIDGIIKILKEDGYPVDEERVLRKNN